VLVVVAVVAAGVGVFAGRAAGQERHASGWDSHIEPVARAVERIRGARFKEAVPVKFLSDAEFKRRLVGPGGARALTPQQDEVVARTIDEVRALGLTNRSTSDVDMTRLINPEGLRSFYDPIGHEVVGRRSDTGVLRDAVIAHELTHALDDQRFGLARLFSRHASSADEVSMVQALVEGDATYAMRRYVEQLSRGQQDRFFAQQDQIVRDVDQQAGDTPRIFVTSVLLPYTLGQWLVAVLAANGGSKAIDAAFKDVPTERIELFDPTTYVKGFRAVQVGEPQLLAGETHVPTPDPAFSAPGLYLTLASRIDPAAALVAADLWAGGTHVEFQRDGTLCDSVAVTGRDLDSTMQMQAVVGAWADVMPPGSVTLDAVPTASEPLIFTACDPGAAATPPERESDATVALPIVRNALIVRALKEHASTDEAKCAADKLVFDNLKVKEILGTAVGVLLVVPDKQIDRFARGLGPAIDGCSGVTKRAAAER
jgi:hypothetical protein